LLPLLLLFDAGDGDGDGDGEEAALLQLSFFLIILQLLVVDV
jgi:hypothetical protein